MGLTFTLCAWAVTATAVEPFAIRVVDAATGRGVPLVELKTVHHVRYVTDNAGYVAFDEPGLVGQRVWFSIRSHGYRIPRDGFGYAGVALETRPGGEAEIRIERLNLAERLYRITGAGLYRDSVILGRPAPLAEPLLNGLVLGQDSVFCEIYRGRLHWFWGDTQRPGHPLGNFHVPGATSRLLADGGLDPAIGIDLRYYTTPGGFAKETCRMPGDGPTWICGLAVVGRGETERMLAGYVKVKPPLQVYRRGIAEWNDAAEQFDPVLDLGAEEPTAWLQGHALYGENGGRRYVWLGDPFPLVRVPADRVALLDLGAYEAFTCLTPGARDRESLDRDAAGRLRWGWKKATRALGPDDERELVESGRLQPDEALLQLRDVETGEPVQAHRGSVVHNAFRRRFVLIACQVGGTSFLGEVWYAEADTPVGPWVYARKVVTHDRYSFYNPLAHPEFSPDDRWLYFEGTYTTLFSGNPDPTPRYDYNQILYRLDLSDPRLALPVAVYRSGGRWVLGPEPPADAKLAFFAFDRPLTGMVGISQDADGMCRVAPDDAAVFWIAPAAAQGAATVEWSPHGTVLGRVWPSPWEEWPGSLRRSP